MGKLKKILFVCLGNICRSPAAEGIMDSLLKREHYDNRIYCDSAGTYGGHSGQRADRRMREHAAMRGYNLTSISRQFVYSDFDEFDMIIAMDDSNISDIKRVDQSGKYSEKIFKMTDFCTEHSAFEVPDPYYGGYSGFENVIDILEDSSEGLLEHIKKEL